MRRKLIAAVSVVVLLTSMVAPALAVTPVQEDDLSIRISDDATDAPENETEDDEDEFSGNFTVNRSTAETTAWNALSERSDKSWTHVESSVHEADGYYEFEYVLDAQNATGEAEIRVSGSTGDVFRFEAETEPTDENEAEDENENEAEDEDEDEAENEDGDENENEDEAEDEDEAENEDGDENENEAEDEDEADDENEAENEE